MLRITVATAIVLTLLSASATGAHAWAPPVPAPPAETTRDSLEVDAAFDRALNALAAGTPAQALDELDLVAAQSRDATRRSTAAALAARIRAAHADAPAGAAAGPATPAAPATAPASAPSATAEADAPLPSTPHAPGPAAPSAGATVEEPDQAGRTVFLATTTLLGLTVYGWTVPTALDIQSNKTFLALYMLTAGTSFVAPYLLTRNRELTWSTTNAAWHGGTRGILHGLMVGGLVDPNGSQRGMALAILTGSALELTAATWWATVADPTPATVRSMGWAGDFGLLFGMGLAHLTGLDLHDRNSNLNENDAGLRLLLASGLVGNAAGLLAGKFLGESRGARLTWGDGEVNRTAGLLGALTGAAIADWFGAFDDEHTRAWVGAMMVGSAAGLYLGHRLVLRTNFSVGRAVLVDLGTIAGGLLGAGITYLAVNGTNDPTPFVTAGAGGALLGFALTTWSLGLREAGDGPAVARSSGITTQLVPMLGRSGQRGVALAGVF